MMAATTKNHTGTTTTRPTPNRTRAKASTSSKGLLNHSWVQGESLVISRRTPAAMQQPPIATPRTVLHLGPPLEGQSLQSRYFGCCEVGNPVTGVASFRLVGSALTNVGSDGAHAETGA